MRAMLLIHVDESEHTPTTPEATAEMYRAYGAFTRELEAAGVLGPADALMPSSAARSVRVRDGRTLITDGPFAEVREQLGGFFIIDVASIEEACAWAARVPDATVGTIEVRPLVEGMAPG